jgi:SAM-dependent methyltransferase
VIARPAAQTTQTMQTTAERRDGGTEEAGTPTILIGGCGEILPYVIRKWEQPGHRVLCVDLSAASLRRARVRLLGSWKRIRCHRGDLDAFLAATAPAAFTHADAYGVIHHLPDPASTLARLARTLAPGGTARLMLYNGAARRWIHELQRCFALLGLDPLRPGDVEKAQRLLAMLGRELPALGDRLGALGSGTLGNAARVADTFLHPREARLGADAWMARIEDAGLKPLGLFDRYAELDDLPNPLWHPPSPAALAERAADGRFENNLELLAVKPPSTTADAVEGRSTRRSDDRQRPRRLPLWTLPCFAKRPPRSWFSYTETAGLGLGVRLKLWHAHLAWVLAGQTRDGEALLRSLPMAAAQRLARIGALLPGQVIDPGRRAALACPLASSMDKPERPRPVPLSAAVVNALEAAQSAAAGEDPRRLVAAMTRLERAQRI